MIGRRCKTLKWVRAVTRSHTKMKKGDRGGNGANSLPPAMSFLLLYNLVEEGRRGGYYSMNTTTTDTTTAYTPWSGRRMHV